MRAVTCGLTVAALALAHLAAAPARGLPLEEQPGPTSPPTSSPTATVVPLPPPDLSGEWSITRAWWRSCPACGMSVIRTSPWTITQSGSAVRVDRGPRGSVSGAVGGGGLLTLEGPEQTGEGVLNLWYSTLRVSPGGDSFEGGINGSERIQNPCGPSPPIVTCFVSGGYANARRVGPPAAGSSRTPTAGAVATASPTSALTPASPSASPSAGTTVPATATATRTAAPGPSVTSVPPVQLFFPSAGS